MVGTNAVMVGTYNKTASIGTATLSSVGLGDIFVARANASAFF